MLPIAFFLTDPHCRGNKIWDKIGYKSACLRDICEIFFASVGEFSEMGHQMLLTEFYLDQPLLPWQQNLRQNGLIQQISSRSLHLTEVRVEGLAIR